MEVTLQAQKEKEKKRQLLMNEKFEALYRALTMDAAVWRSLQKKAPSTWSKRRWMLLSSNGTARIPIECSASTLFLSVLLFRSLSNDKLTSEKMRFVTCKPVSIGSYHLNKREKFSLTMTSSISNFGEQDSTLILAKRDFAQWLRPKTNVLHEGSSLDWVSSQTSRQNIVLVAVLLLYHCLE